jgi:predicted DNA-binding WGR domain protein
VTQRGTCTATTVSDVQRDLFGAWCFIQEWGRIGQVGQTRSVPYPTPHDAAAALDRQRCSKERRGYAAAGAGILSGVTWDDDSSCRCAECAHHGKVRDFKVTADI